MEYDLTLEGDDGFLAVVHEGRLLKFDQAGLRDTAKLVCEDGSRPVIAAISAGFVSLLDQIAEKLPPEHRSVLLEFNLMPDLEMPTTDAADTGIADTGIHVLSVEPQEGAE